MKLSKYLLTQCVCWPSKPLIFEQADSEELEVGVALVGVAREGLQNEERKWILRTWGKMVSLQKTFIYFHVGVKAHTTWQMQAFRSVVCTVVGYTTIFFNTNNLL